MIGMRSPTTQMRRLVILVTLISGCHEWVPVTSLADIHDDTVRMTTSESTVTLKHATGNGTVIEGTPVSPVSSASLLECHHVDAKSAVVRRRQFDGASTVALVVLSGIGAAMAVFGGGVLVAFAGMGNMK